MILTYYSHRETPARWALPTSFYLFSSFFKFIFVSIAFFLLVYSEFFFARFLNCDRFSGLARTLRRDLLLARISTPIHCYVMDKDVPSVFCAWLYPYLYSPDPMNMTIVISISTILFLTALWLDEILDEIMIRPHL